MRKIMGKVSAGVLGALVNIATLGVVSLKGNTTQKGFMGQGLEKTGRPYKATFFNDIRNQIAQFRTTVRARPGGPSALDYTSALLRAFNEMVVQNVINVAGKISLVSGILATVITAGSLGFAAPAAAPLAAISAVAAFVALIAAAVKVGVDLVRLTVDGLAALLNDDAKLSNVLGARAKQSGMETLFDAVQTVGSGTGPATGSMIKGQGFINQFDLGATKAFNVSQLSASHSLGTTVGATAASAGQSVGAPLLTGPVAQGLKAASDEDYDMYTQHPDDRDRGGRARLEASSMPSPNGGSKGVDSNMPHWMQSEMAKQNKLRKDAFKSRTALAVGQLEAVAVKSSQAGNKLTKGKGDADKLASLTKGGESEDQETAKAQASVIGEGGLGLLEAVAGIKHGQSEIRKLGDKADG
jgi:hypothetical protein